MLHKLGLNVSNLLVGLKLETIMAKVSKHTFRIKYFIRVQTARITFTSSSLLKVGRV